MEGYQKEFVKLLADSGALFFEEGLNLKDQRPTPYFVNIGAFGEKSSLRWKLANAYAGLIKQKINEGAEVDLVIGLSYKGSMIAADATMALFLNHQIDLGCSYDRKEVKDHGEGSSNQNMFVGAQLFDNANLYIVDDVGTSMKTKLELLEKIALESERRGINTNVVGIGIAFDREQVGPVYDENGDFIPNARGTDAIKEFVDKTGISVDSIVGARDAMNFLEESGHPVKIDGKMQSMPYGTSINFENYMGVYGTK